MERLTRRVLDAALPSARPFAAAISTAPVFKRRSRRVLEPRFLPDAVNGEDDAMRRAPAFDHRLAVLAR